MNEIRRKLLGWFKKNNRDYPWRKTSNWFHLLMAEMMLRRTKADQALTVYESFTSKYTTANEAAKEEESRMVEIFAPLGLNWRIHQMVETIRYTATHHPRHPPHTRDEFLMIPGVGDYSASMLQNRLYDLPVAAMDSNVSRVVCRLFGLKWTPESRRNKQVIQKANELVSSKQSKNLNLALLDLSALVCKPGQPSCEKCPLAPDCAFAQSNGAAHPSSSE